MRFKKVTYNNNAIYLIIVESPSKCQKIEHFLGTDYQCIASIGHLRNITGLSSIDTKNDFKPTFSIINEKEKHIENMKKVISNFIPENIILASDDDREGEAIAWHICEIFNLNVKKTKRIIFHEITKHAITQAVQNPTVINMNLVQAQLARQILDIIVGYRVSPYLWKYLYNDKTNSLSAGRCQTPALNLIYENHLKQNEEPDKKYKTTGLFTAKKIEFSLNKDFYHNNEIEEFLRLTIDFKHMLSIQSPKESEKSSPIPFQTSKLLQTASNVLHYSPKQTMEICQKLYQGGYITYMRTESTKYSNTFINKACEYIEKNYSKEFIGNTYKIKNSDSNNPHEAIRVTNIHLRTLSNDSDKKLNALYKLIWKNTLQSCMANAKYKVIKLNITAPNEYYYTSSLESPIFLGWKIIDENKSLEELQSITNGLLFYLQQSNKLVYYDKILTSLSISNKNPHYTESSLIQKLENIGIGRPSTYASIVHTLLERKYVLKQDIPGKEIETNTYILEKTKLQIKNEKKTFCQEKNKLVIQPLGILSLEFLVSSFENLFSYDYTKNMETELDLISNGEFNNEWNQLCKNCYFEISEYGKLLKKLSKASFPINEDYNLFFEKNGPVLQTTGENKKFVSVNPNIEINIDKLKNNEYTIEQLILEEPEHLGTYQNHEISIKYGKYGHYASWGDNKESVKNIGIPIEKITLEVLIDFLENKKEKSYLRKLNENMEVRKGKYGMYVYYQSPSMKKPKFLNIKKFKDGILTASIDDIIVWINETYKLQEK